MSKYIFKVGMVAFVTILFSAWIGAATTIQVGPGESIQLAIDAANDGDLILVQSGIYLEKLNVSKKLTLKGEDSAGGKPVIDAGGDGNGITLNADFVTIQGFIVTNARIGIDVVSSNNKIIDNEVRDSWTGIFLRSSSGNMLEDNEIYGNWRGIYLKDSGANNVFDNAVKDNKWSAVALESSDNNIIKENLIRSNYRAFELINSEENTILDNEVAENKFNDVPSSADSMRDFADIVGEMSSEAPSAGISDTTALETARPEISEDGDEAFDESAKGSANESADEIKTPVPEGPIVDTDADPVIEDPKSDAGDGRFEPAVDEEIEDSVAENVTYDASNDGEGSGSSGGGLPSEKETADADEMSSEQVVRGSSANVSEGKNAKKIVDVKSEEPLKTDGSEAELVGGASSEDVSDEDVSAVVGEEERSLDELDAVPVGNDTVGFVIKDEERAARTKSNSGAWKIYEYLKYIGERIENGGTDSQPAFEEMNFSEMVEKEVASLDLGTISFYVPKEMTVGVSEKVESAIAKDVQEDLAERLESLGAPEGEVDELNVSIRSVLEGDNFQIKPLDDEVQFAADEGIARWSWDVTPLKSGVQDLSLHVAVVVELSDGSTVQKEYNAIERRIGVDLSFVHIVLYLAERVSDFTAA